MTGLALAVSGFDGIKHDDTQFGGYYGRENGIHAQSSKSHIYFYYQESKLDICLASAESLSCSPRSEIIKLLIESGADVNTCGSGRSVAEMVTGWQWDEFKSTVLALCQGK